MNFVKNLLPKGYAKESTAVEKEVKCWYPPHHGVNQANKPGKIPVVFDRI